MASKSAQVFSVPELLKMLEAAHNNVLAENRHLLQLSSQLSDGSIVGPPSSNWRDAMKQAETQNEAVQLAIPSCDQTKRDSDVIGHDGSPCKGRDTMQSRGVSLDGTSSKGMGFSPDGTTSKGITHLALKTLQTEIFTKSNAEIFQRIQNEINYVENLASQIEEEVWHVGLWKDRANYFFDGAQICIGLKEWAPNSHKYKEDSEYRVTPGDGTLEMNLCEVDEDGSLQVFTATKSKRGGVLIVTSELWPEERWVLDRVVADHATSLSLTDSIQRMVSTPHLSGRRSPWVLILGARMLVKSSYFQYFIGTVIVCNSLCLGMQSELSLPDGPGSSPVLDHLESVFLGIYVIEAGVNLLARGWLECFRDAWFIFDMVLIVLGAAYEWCIKYMTHNQAFMGQLMVLRSLRLLRMLRALRMLPLFRTGWRLVLGLMSSVNTMLSTLALVALFLYAFACLGLEIITKNDAIREHPDLQPLVDQKFGSLFGTMVSLLQFVTLDSLSTIYGPLVLNYPLLILYFMPIIVILSISLMNLVTAVLVEGAFVRSYNDREAERHALVNKAQKEVPIYRALFKQLDTSGDGTLSIQELNHLTMRKVPGAFRKALHHFRFESMYNLFEMLDCDMSGNISEEEFVDGLLNLSLSELHQVPPEIFLILKLSRTMSRNTRTLLKDFVELRGDVQQLWTELERSGPKQLSCSSPEQYSSC